MIEVVLTPEEIDEATQVGKLRRQQSMKLGHQERHGVTKNMEYINIAGALGEQAVAKALGIKWQKSINTFNRGGDVDRYEVRTMSKHHWDLLIRPKDRDDAIFILVTGTSPEYRVHGWIYARDAKKQQWIQTYANRPAAYFVPQSALRPIEELE